MEVTRSIVLPVTRDEAWEALTEPERLREWFANDVELDVRPGGEGVFRWENGESRRAVVDEVEALALLIGAEAQTEDHLDDQQQDERSDP